MIGDHEERRVGDELTQTRDALIEEHVEILGAAGVRGEARVPRVLRIERGPEAVVQAVGGHLHHHEEVGRPMDEHVLRQIEVPHHLGLERREEALGGLLVLGVDVGSEVRGERAPELRFERAREGAHRGVARREHARDHLAPDHRRRRKGGGHEEDAGSLAMRPEHVPHPRHPHVVGRDRAERA